MHKMSSLATTDEQSAQDLASSLTRNLHGHLEALRVILESLGRGLEGDPHKRVLAIGIEGLERIDRDVALLFEYSSPQDLQPLRCSMEEVARAAFRIAASTDKDRIWLANESSAVSMNIDAPLLSRTLAYFLENALDRGSSEILFHARQDETTTYFTILDDMTGDLIGLLPEAWEVGSGPEDDVLEVAIARRDISRMGGRAILHETSPGKHFVLVEIPHDLRPLPGEGALP